MGENPIRLTFDGRNRKNYIDGVSVNFLKLFESSIFLQFAIRPNSAFFTLFNTICNSLEWMSSATAWNDWLSIVKGYNPFLHVSNEDRIRRKSYMELIADLRASMREIIYDPLLKGIRSNLISEGSEAVVYTAGKSMRLTENHRFLRQYILHLVELRLLKK